MISLLSRPMATWQGQRTRHGVRQRAFHAGEVEPLPEPSSTAMQQHFLVTVVPGELHDGVVARTKRVDLVEQRTEVTIEFERTIGPVPLPILPLYSSRGAAGQCISEWLKYR